MKGYESEYVILPYKDDSAKEIRAIISYVPADISAEMINTKIKTATIALSDGKIIYY